MAIEYLKELLETFYKKPIRLLCTAFLIWVLLPVIVLIIGGAFLLFQIITLEKFVILFSNAILPYWTSIIINFKIFLLEYLLVFILTLILVNHEIIGTIDFRQLVNFLKKN